MSALPRLLAASGQGYGYGVARCLAQQLQPALLQHLAQAAARAAAGDPAVYPQEVQGTDCRAMEEGPKRPLPEVSKQARGDGEEFVLTFGRNGQQWQQLVSMGAEANMWLYSDTVKAVQGVLRRPVVGVGAAGCL